MQTKQQDIEQLLCTGKNIQIKPQGYSMYPVLVPGRDEAIIEPIEVSKLKRGDVVLYRRTPDASSGNILVLHRIWKCEESGFYMVGDNQTQIEGPLQSEQIKGIMVGIIRKGKYISVRNLCYRLLTGMWLALRPMRPLFWKVAAGVRRILGGSKKQNPEE